MNDVYTLLPAPGPAWQGVSAKAQTLFIDRP